MIDKQKIKLGLLVGIISLVLTFLVNTILKSISVTFTLAVYNIDIREQVEKGLSGSLTEKIFGMLSGVLPITLPKAILVLISGVSIVYFGSWIIQFFKVKIKTENRLWLTLLIGSLIVSLILSFASIITLSFIPTLIALSIYFLIISYIVKYIISKGYIKIGGY